jgi:hypothetical protein
MKRRKPPSRRGPPRTAARWNLKMGFGGKGSDFWVPKSIFVQKESRSLFHKTSVIWEEDAQIILGDNSSVFKLLSLLTIDFLCLIIYLI